MLVANYEFYESIDKCQQDEYDIVLKASKGKANPSIVSRILNIEIAKR